MKNLNKAKLGMKLPETSGYATIRSMGNPGETPASNPQMAGKPGFDLGSSLGGIHWGKNGTKVAVAMNSQPVIVTDKKITGLNRKGP